MRWGQDKLVDQLIADNTARPRPGMDKPDKAMLAITSGVRFEIAQSTRRTASE